MKLAEEINKLHIACVRTEKQSSLYARISFDNAVKCARKLIEAKEKCQHGEWIKWIAENLDINPTTVNKYMTIAEHYVKPEIYPDFSPMAAFDLLKRGNDIREQVLAANVKITRNLIHKTKNGVDRHGKRKASWSVRIFKYISKINEHICENEIDKKDWLNMRDELEDLIDKINAKIKIAS